MREARLWQILVLLAVAAAWPARAGTLYFRYGSTNYMWINVANWFVPDGMGGYVAAGKLPGASDDVELQDGPDGGAGLIQVHSITVEGVNVMNGAYTTPTLVMQPGSSFTGSTITILDDGQMEVVGVYGESACSLSGTKVTIEPGSTLSVGTNGFLNVIDGTFVCNQGVVNLSDGAVVEGLPGTNTLDIVVGAQLVCSGGATIEAIANGSPGYFALNNSGLVLCNSGTLEVSPSVITSTNWLAAFKTAISNASIYLYHPSVPPGVTFAIFGPGISSLGEGMTEIDGTLQAGGVDPYSHLQVAGNLTAVQQARIAGTGQLHVFGGTSPASTLSSTNAIFTDVTLNIDPGAIFAIVDSAQFISNNINNSGTVTWSTTYGDWITLSGGATFSNLASGTFIEEDGRGGIGGVTSTPLSLFNNLGTFQVDAGTNVTQLGSELTLQFNNHGVLDVVSGRVNMNNGESSGQFNLAGGTTLTFESPTNILDAGASLTGTGSIIVQSPLIINGNVTMPNLTLEGGGVIDGPGQLTVTGAFGWNSGTLQGSGAVNIPPSGTMTLGGSVNLYERVINNSGTINWSASSELAAGAGAVINNLSGATFDLQNSGEVLNGGGLPYATFNNFGTVAKTGGENDMPLNLNFNNAGSLQVLTQSVSFPLGFRQTSGATIVAAGATLGASGGISLQGGTLGGVGTIAAPITNSDGVIAPGMPTGTLTLAGGSSYAQSTNGVLSIDIGGPTAGTQHSQLAAAGCPVSLGGSLNVNLLNEFMPTNGQRFTILTGGPVSGTFPVLNGVYLGNDLVLAPVYSATNVVLVAETLAVLRPTLTLARGAGSAGGLELSWRSVPSQAYEVQYSPDLTQWFALTNVLATGGAESLLFPPPPPGVPRLFYRLR